MENHSWIYENRWIGSDWWLIYYDYDWLTTFLERSHSVATPLWLYAHVSTFMLHSNTGAAGGERGPHYTPSRAGQPPDLTEITLRLIYGILFSCSWRRDMLPIVLLSYQWRALHLQIKYERHIHTQHLLLFASHCVLFQVINLYCKTSSFY